MRYSVHEARTQLSQLLDLVENGEEVVIIRYGEAVAKLVPVRKPGKRVLGSMRGQISWTEGWERPMTDQEANVFFAGK